MMNLKHYYFYYVMKYTSLWRTGEDGHWHLSSVQSRMTIVSAQSLNSAVKCFLIFSSGIQILTDPRTLYRNVHRVVMTRLWTGGFHICQPSSCFEPSAQQSRNRNILSIGCRELVCSTQNKKLCYLILKVFNSIK